jgi:hypothetical protein
MDWRQVLEHVFAGHPEPWLLWPELVDRLLMAELV